MISCDTCYWCGSILTLFGNKLYLSVIAFSRLPVGFLPVGPDAFFCNV